MFKVPVTVEGCVNKKSENLSQMENLSDYNSVITIIWRNIVQP